MHDFMSLFCQRFQCSPAEFKDRVLRLCLPWPARMLGPLLRGRRPDYFTREFALIENLGKAKDMREVRLELLEFRMTRHLHWSVTRNVLGLQISAAKVARLASSFLESECGNPAQTGADDPASSRS